MGSHNGDNIDKLEVEETRTSQPTVEIKIKTLDSQTYTLRVDKCVSRFLIIIISYAKVNLLYKRPVLWGYVFLLVAFHKLQCFKLSSISCMFKCGKLVVSSSKFVVNQPWKYLVT